MRLSHRLDFGWDYIVLSVHQNKSEIVSVLRYLKALSFKHIDVTHLDVKMSLSKISHFSVVVLSDNN